MAVRRSLSLLVPVLVAFVILAAQARGQDFNFTAVPRVTLGITNQGAVGTLCSTGVVSFDSTGGVLDAFDLRCDGNQITIFGGTLTIAGNGSVMGTVGDEALIGQLLPGGRGFVAVDTLGPNSSIPGGFGLTVFVDPSNASFTQANLTGTWRLKLLRGTQDSGGSTETAFGSVVFGSTGAVIGGGLTFSDFRSESFVGGNVSVLPGNVGQLAGFVVTDDGELTTLSDVFALMAPDKNFVAGISFGEDPFGSRNHSGMFFLQRAPTVGYTMADLAGTWNIFSLQSVANESTDGGWFMGTATFDSNGVITAATLVNAAGQTFPAVASGSFSLTPDGFISGFTEFVSAGPPEPPLARPTETGGGQLSTQATMLQNKQQIIGVNSFCCDGFNPFTVGLFSMIKQGPPPPASSVQFSTSTSTVTEGGTASIVVTRSGATSTAVTVDFTAVDPMTETPLASGTLAFAAGQTSRTFAVPTTQNNVVDGNRVVTLQLSNPTNGATLGARSTATLTVLDDDSTFQFSQATYDVTEGGKATITVTRTGGLAFPNVVSFTATPGTAVPALDFTPVSGALSFAANIASRTFNVPIINNTRIDGDRTVLLTLSSPPLGERPATGAAPLGTVLGEQSTATLVIHDNDRGGLIRLSSATYSGAEGGTVVVTIQRLAVPGGTLGSNVSVSYTTSSINGSATETLDYTPQSGTVTFTSPTDNTKTVRIPLGRDGIVEGSENFHFILSDPTLDATLGTPSVATVTITDVDKGGVVVLGQSKYTVSEGAGNVSITIKRSGGSAGNVSVLFSTSDGTAMSEGSDYGDVFTTVVFGVGETLKTVVVPIFQDARAEGNEVFTVRLSDPQGGATLGSPGSAPVTIVDDESAIQFEQASFSAREGTPGLITVIRSGALTTTAVVSYNLSPVSAVLGVDFTGSLSGVLTFAPRITKRTFTIPTINNPRVDGDRSIWLSLGPPTGGAQLGTNATATFTITDDDQPGVFRLSSPTYSVKEGVLFAVVDILRMPAPGNGRPLGGNVSINYATSSGNASAGSDFTDVSGTLVFNPLETKRSLKIPILPDQIIEGTETFFFTLSDPGSGAGLAAPSTATIVLLDDDVGGVVFLSQASYSVSEGAGNISITVVRSGGAAADVSVDFRTVDDTADRDDDGEGGDYRGVFTTLTFAANEMSKTVVIRILQDSRAEGNEIFHVELSNPTGGLRLGSPASAPVTILDDEQVIQFSNRFIRNQPEVVRTGPLVGTVSVDYFAESGTAILGEDFRLPAGTLVFPPGVSSRTIPIAALADDIAEGPETFSITLFNPTPPGQLGPNSSKEFTLDDRDFGGTVRFATSALTAFPGESKQLTIMRSGGLGIILTVRVFAEDGDAVLGEDFTLSTDTVTFDRTETSKTITVNVLDTEAMNPPDKAVVFGFSVPAGAAAMGAINTSTITILGSASVVQFGSPTYSVAEADETATITVTRSGNTDRTVSVAYATSNGSASSADYTPTSGVLTFEPGQTLLTFSVPVASDDTTETPETINLTLDNVSEGGVLGPQATAVLTITDVAGLEVVSRSTAGTRGNADSAQPAVSADGRYVAFVSLATNLATGAGAGAGVYVRDRVTGTTELVSVGTSGPEDGAASAVAISADARYVAFVSTSSNLVAGDTNGFADVFVRDRVTGTTQRVSVSASGVEADGPSADVAISPDGTIVAFSAVTDTLVAGAGTTSNVYVFDRTTGLTEIVSATDEMLPSPQGASRPTLSQDGRLVAFVSEGLLADVTGKQIYLRDRGAGTTVVVSQNDGTPANGTTVDAPAISPDGRFVAFVSDATNLGASAGQHVYVVDRMLGSVELISQKFDGPAGNGASDDPALTADGRFVAFVSAATNLVSGDTNAQRDVFVYDRTTGLTRRINRLADGTQSNGFTDTVALNADGTFAAFATSATSLSTGDINDAFDVLGVPLTIPPLPSADIAVSMSVNPVAQAVGGNVTFMVVVTNEGPGAPSGIVVNDSLPAGYTFVTASPSQGVYTSSTGVWSVGGLSAGASATLQIVATVLVTGPYVNTATRTASDPGDPNAANDSASVAAIPPAITLTTDGPLVGVGRTISGTVSLPSTATGDVIVTLTASPAGILTVPSTVTVPTGSSSAPFTVTGVAVGGATITGSASSFVPGDVSVTVTSSVISLGALATLGPGQTLSLPISLSVAAPAGGVTVSFSSGNGSVATVTATVFIPAGSQVPAANPQVTGIAVGSTGITASATGFGPDSRTANVVINVTFTPSPFSVVVGTSKNITVNLSAPAPSGGFTLSLATGNTSVATVVSSITVLAGQTSVQAAVTGVVIASTTLQASGTGVTSATVTINVTVPPPLTISSQSVGKDLQVQTSVSLGAAAPAGGLAVTLTSADPTKMLVSASQTTAGSGSIVVTVGAGGFARSYYVQALVDTGTVTLTATAPGFQDAASTITLTPSGFIINSPGNFPTTTLDGNTSIQIISARLTAGSLAFAGSQELRGGITPVFVSVTATDQSGGPGVGSITSSPLTFNGGDFFKNTSFDPAVEGSSLIQVPTPAGFTTPATFVAITATVSAPRIFPSSVTIGKDLQVNTSLSLEAPAPTGGAPVTLTSLDPSKVLLSTSQTTAGSASIVVTVGAGGFSGSYYVQALANTGTVGLTASSPGYQNGSATITLAPSGFIINFPSSFSTTTLSGNSTIQIISARLNAGSLTFSTNQELRGGITPVSVSVTATDQSGGPGVGAITSSPLTFNGGDFFKSTAFDPMAAGTSLIQVVTPAGFDTSATFTSITVTVTAPRIFLSSVTVGKDLQLNTSLSLEAAAPTGGVAVTVTSLDPSKVLLSTSQTAVGATSIVVNFTTGASFGSFYVQALDSTGTVTLEASAPGYQNGSATITLAPSGFIINFPSSFTTTTFSGNSTIQIISARLTAGSLAFSTNQEVRAGVTASVDVTATDQTGGPGVGAITVSPLVFNGGENFKSTFFNPAAAGTSLVQLGTPAGFSTPSNFQSLIATVTAPAISLSTSNVLVGRDLQTLVSVSLAATPPSPVTVTLNVASPAIATLTVNGAVEGGNTLTFSNVAGTFVGSFYVQGRASSGTTTITTQAPGYTDNLTTVTAQPSGFIINSPGNFTTTAAAANTTVQIVSARLDSTTLNFASSQEVRGGASVSVPVTAVDLSGGPGVGAITTSPLAFGGGTSAVNTQFNPAVAGTSQISVGVPAGFNTPSNFRQITATVNP